MERRHTLRDHTPRADDAAAVDRHARHDGDPAPDPDVVFDRYGAGERGPVASGAGAVVERVRDGVDGDVGADQAAGADREGVVRRVGDLAVAVYEGCRVDGHAGAVVDDDWDLDHGGGYEVGRIDCVCWSGGEGLGRVDDAVVLYVSGGRKRAVRRKSERREEPTCSKH